MQSHKMTKNYRTWKMNKRKVLKFLGTKWIESFTAGIT